MHESACGKTVLLQNFATTPYTGFEPRLNLKISGKIAGAFSALLGNVHHLPSVSLCPFFKGMPTTSQMLSGDCF